MPPNKMTLKDLENFLSTPRIGGGLSKAASALRRAEEERQSQRSVFNQPREPEWQPDHVRPGGHALEAPMISPDDLFGTGIPTKIAMALKGAAPLIGGLGVIKNKGGNWLSGSVEGALSGLKKPQVMLYGLGDDAAADAEKVRSAGLNSFIDKQLTRYVKNEMATPEDPIRALAETWPERKAGMLTEQQTRLNKAVMDRAQAAQDRELAARLGVSVPIPDHYLTSSNARVNDMQRQLAELQLREGIHSINLPDVHPKELAYINANRELQGFPAGGERSRWEDLSDLYATPLSAREVKLGWFAPEGTGVRDLANNPWLDKIPGDTPVFGRSMRGRNVASDLGFNHLTDELANALNPESGLPRHLLLDPKSMDRVSVPQAVERVSQINAWRAAQKAEADALKANNAATHLHKEYPDKGFKWVELKSPEPKTFEELTPKQQEWYHDYLNEGVSPEGALRNAAKRDPQALQDALKYEGDTMGHCVGGYCDDVASGRSRIYSLRDAKGQPHVTVEVAGPQGFAGKKSREEYEAFLRGHETPHSEEEIAQALQDLDKGGAWSPRIQQIKGKQNRAPNEEYLPFVQDFVKSGKWSDVGDLQNTGLQRAGWSSEILQQLQQHGIDAPEYGTVDEINATLNALNKAKGFAHGGTVDKNNLSVQQLQAIIAQLRQEHINAA